MTTKASDKPTSIVLVQDADTMIRAVRINGALVPVINAGPVVTSAGMGVAMTLAGDITVEKAEAQS